MCGIESAFDTCFPEILAPAGDVNSFLAAMGAGADAVYLGLKQFSARMEADNFGISELGRMTELAHKYGRKIYVAMNGLLKQNEVSHAFRLVKRLVAHAPVDGLIVQDLAMIDIARQASFEGAIAFSTLANITFQHGLFEAARLGATRVVLPRELSLEEMRAMGESCPGGMELECFVHGALCYCVSGRCYWSSYMGGKSGLRGRCVQPCRRIYTKGTTAKGGERYFSCQDLELGAMVKNLLSVPSLRAWKIEGRKKGPHYVFHTVTAYKILRDKYDDPQARKMAEEILAMALGRPGVKGRFSAKARTFPMAPGKQTASGLMIGRLACRPEGACELKTRHELLKGDRLRIGTEDERWHATLTVSRPVPKGGTLPVRVEKHKTPESGTPVFLVDRREPQLLGLLSQWRKKLEALAAPSTRDVQETLVLPVPEPVKRRLDMCVATQPGRGRDVWLNAKVVDIPGNAVKMSAFWLQPVIWPEEEEKILRQISLVWKKGARRFVCNAPWQRALFPENLPENAELIAGPFCNIANTLALQELRNAGYKAAIISPELSRKEILELPKISPLPLGLLIKGFWPVGISRFGLTGINVNEEFNSPKGEGFWARNHGGNIWIFPAWPLDISEKKSDLLQAGYSFFVTIEERKPDSLSSRKRAGLFNWDGHLL